MPEQGKIETADVTMRPARLADAEMLSEWASRPHVLTATGGGDGFDWHGELARDLSWREIWIAESGGRPVGMSIIIDAAREETHYWGDVPMGSRALDVWLGDVRDTGSGIGSAFMLLLLGRIFEDPAATRLLVDPLASNGYAIRFYRRLGFRSLGRRMFEGDDCEVLEMDRRDGVLAQLSAMEPIFHRMQGRSIDRKTLEAFVSPEFWEVGASGKIYERDFVIEAVLDRGLDHPDRRMACSEFRLVEICTNVFQLGYLLADDGRLSRRTSLWRREQGRWLLLFHQGTILVAGKEPGGATHPAGHLA
ncbi:MAG: GNAT family N-acetyltransferase [Porphyrobacter sp.]|nr:GNAT family N-acetyltransferase [Porphyrobacter sp.]